MYMCIYIYTHTCTYVYIYICKCVYIYVYMYKCVLIPKPWFLDVSRRFSILAGKNQ